MSIPVTPTSGASANERLLPRAPRLIAILLAARWRSIRHKVGGMLTHWPGRLACIGVVLVSARLLWILVAPPYARASAIHDPLLRDALGAALVGGITVWGARSVARPPVIMGTGEIGVVDSGLLIRAPLTAGVLARLPAPVIGGLYVAAVLISLAPAWWANLDSRLRLWAVLTALGAWMTSARLACGCAAWAWPRTRPLLTLAWWTPAAAVLWIVTARVPEQGVGALNVLGDVFTVMTARWWPTVLLAAAAAGTYAAVIALAPRLTPVWAAPAYQIAAILDLADSRDASAALALMRPAHARSGRMPAVVHGAAAFAVRQWWEAGRRHSGRVLVSEALAAYAVGHLVGLLLPQWWLLAFMIVGGFAVSSGALDGAVAQAHYPLFATASSTRRSALAVGAWSCLLPALQASAICLLTVFGGARAHLPGEAVGVALGCAITWPLFAAACSVAAALLAVRGVSNRLTAGVGGLAALGGPLLFAIGQGTAALAPGYPVYVAFAAQAVAAALVSWALLHMALATWSASRYTVRTNQVADSTDLSTTINNLQGTKE
ncbi:hypothetical protein [Actinomyces qiguomingii]|uniref:hypothetical protein n=1 Tax=Actinomyces qiguomingii TaxID=2057800 RepID=UPI000CA0636F|nr:hypothetical protein [Actinomyces qiguomingii]